MKKDNITMLRYHKKIYFPNNALAHIQALTDKLNGLKWQYSTHCLDNLKYRLIDNKAVLLYIKNLVLEARQVFEYYSQDNKIIKTCYRVPYINDIDLILVVNNNKCIITIYI